MDWNCLGQITQPGNGMVGNCHGGNFCGCGGVARQDVERGLAKILDKTVGTLPPLLLVQYVCDEP